MNKKERINLIRELESELAYGRFVHTLGVSGTAAALAMCYGEELDKAELAGLLHDCAKCMNLSKMLKICEKAGVELSDLEKKSGSLLHSKAGAVLARDKYGVNDEDVLNAIRYHTTGRPGMRHLEQIVFIADYIEPRRNKSKRLPEIRMEAFRDLDECCYLILKDMLIYLHSKSSEIEPHTQEAYHFYEEVHEERRD